MREQRNLIRKLKLKALILVVTALTMSFPVAAQTDVITLPAKRLSAAEVFENIQKQTNFIVGVKSNSTTGLWVDINRSPVTVKDALDRLLSGSGMSYRVDGNYIVIVEKPAQTTSAVAVSIPRNIAGTVNDAEGAPMEGAAVCVAGVDGKTAVTFANGRFLIEGILPGNHILKLTSAGGETIRYREVNVPAGRDADVTLVLAGATLASAVQEQPAPIASSVKTTAYFVPNTADNTIHAFAEEAKSQYSFVPSNNIGKQYMPKAAVKTNLLVLGTATPNVAVEFALARKWTLDISAAYNPFQLEEGGVNYVTVVSPEVRWWFCQRFEKHFVGLHALAGTFNIGDVTFLTRTFETNRYDGWGVGGGLTYGYHLPVSKLWAVEFTAGAGYVFLKYDKYRCYDCDEYLGKKGKHYFGPTKAGVSLIFMIK